MNHATQQAAIPARIQNRNGCGFSAESKTAMVALLKTLTRRGSHETIVCAAAQRMNTRDRAVERVRRKLRRRAGSRLPSGGATGCGGTPSPSCPAPHFSPRFQNRNGCGFAAVTKTAIIALLHFPLRAAAFFTPRFQKRNGCGFAAESKTAIIALLKTTPSGVPA